MSLDWLNFLMNPWFVLPWYGFGIFAAAWVLYDVLTTNRHVNQPLKAGWPIITVFFSVLGLGLYLLTCRPPEIERFSGEQAKKRHHAFVAPRWKKVVGSVIHCVGGDGLGIITAMVIARLLDLTFWPEFWFEYAVGFAFGWFIFQLWAMRRMGHSWGVALLRGGRAEFFSMLTVMLGMGLVMRFVTPAVVGARPDPSTAAFWGFAALGLLVGAVITYPMNWWLVAIKWKHGMS